MIKFIPHGTLCLLHFMSLIEFPLFASFALGTEGDLRKWLLIGLAAVWIVGWLLFALSFICLWNVPLAASAEGITTKGKKLHPWSEAVSIRAKIGLRILHGHSLLLIIDYSDGSTVVFEPTKPLIKAINKLCPDERFLEEINRCLKDIF